MPKIDSGLNLYRVYEEYNDIQACRKVWKSGGASYYIER